MKQIKILKTNNQTYVFKDYIARSIINEISGNLALTGSLDNTISNLNYIKNSDLSGLTDVLLTNLSGNQFLQYNSTTEKWQNKDLQIPNGSLTGKLYNDGVFETSQILPEIINSSYFGQNCTILEKQLTQNLTVQPNKTFAFAEVPSGITITLNSNSSIIRSFIFKNGSKLINKFGGLVIDCEFETGSQVIEG